MVKECNSPLHNFPVGAADPTDPDGIYVTDCAHKFPYLVEQLAWGKHGAVQLWFRHGTSDAWDEVYIISPDQRRYGAVEQVWGNLHGRLMTDDMPKPGVVQGRSLGESIKSMRSTDEARAAVLLGAVEEQREGDTLTTDERAKLEAFALASATALRHGYYVCAACEAKVPTETVVLDADGARYLCPACNALVDQPEAQP